MKVLHAVIEFEGESFEVTRTPTSIEVRRGTRLVAWMSGRNPISSVEAAEAHARRFAEDARLMRAVLDEIGVTA